MTTTPPKPRDSATKVFGALTGVTSLLIFVQAILAGEFVSQDDRDPWIAAHDVVANATVLVALVTAVWAIVLLRKTYASLAWGSAALFVILVVQTLIGHLVTDAKQDGWIGVHVPLALIAFGLTIWLSIRGASLRKATAAA